MTSALPDLSTVPTPKLEEWLRRNDLPVRDLRLIDAEYIQRLATELFYSARPGQRSDIASPGPAQSGKRWRKR